MGKGTDKLYITHSEWSSSDAYGASAGANVRPKGRDGSSFKQLPYNYCAASLQPFKNPVCTADGTIFDVEIISSWLDKHKTNPVNGQPLHAKDLIRLSFARNSESDHGQQRDTLVDPVTFKVFTDNTHIVAVRHGNYANVFAWDTIERMNIKAKHWRDLVDDAEFKRADIITLQDPQNVQGRDLNQFKHVKDGAVPVQGIIDGEGTQEGDININALGRMGDKVLRAKSAVERARRSRETGGDVNKTGLDTGAGKPNPTAPARPTGQGKRVVALNSATYTTGKTAASFTSTGLTPETSNERAILTDEEYLLKPKRVRIKGYARIEMQDGELTIELYTETAPRAVWNFVRLAQRGYYDGVAFHRNIPGFMVQGGDPDGSGRGGKSVWGKYFDDELGGTHTHDARGIVSMANKGKNTNSSQFFITYGPAPHLDRKHTIFGRVMSGMDVLAKMEAVPTDGSDRPLNKIAMNRVVVFVDPFAEFQKRQTDDQRVQRERAEVQGRGGNDDDRTTWTGKRLRQDGTARTEESSERVGRYLPDVLPGPSEDSDEAVDDVWEEPVKKKARGGGGFGNFDSW